MAIIALRMAKSDKPNRLLNAEQIVGLFSKTKLAESKPAIPDSKSKPIIISPFPTFIEEEGNNSNAPLAGTTLMRIMILAIRGKLTAFRGNEIGTIPESIMNFTMIDDIYCMAFTRIDA
jgi:hypothetical protein